MKKLLLLTICLFLLSACQQTPPANKQSDRDGVAFVFPEQFGRSFTFVAEIIEKNNSYYAQMMVTPSFYLKIISIEGNELETPIIIEPQFRGTPPDYVIGSTLELHGYERLQQIGSPRIQGSGRPQQVDFHYANAIVVLTEDD